MNKPARAGLGLMQMILRSDAGEGVAQGEEPALAFLYISLVCELRRTLQLVTHASL